MARLVYTPKWLSTLLFIMFWTAPAFGEKKDDEKAPPKDLIKRDWSVGGTKRKALIHVPPQAETKPSALVFVFHGGSGTMKDAADKVVAAAR